VEVGFVSSEHRPQHWTLAHPGLLFSASHWSDEKTQTETQDPK
jgi:hypothetical protein